MSTSPRRNSQPGFPDRISRIRDRYQNGPAFISIERARHFTASWRQTENQGLSVQVRTAQAMKHVYEQMNIHLDPDDRIAGTWCEFFLGIPIDIERGVFNAVLEAELDRGAMVRFRVGALARGLGYILRKGMLGEFVHNQRLARSAGASPLNMDLKTMSERQINPYQVRPEDKQELLGDLIPYWKGRSVVDVIENEMLDSGLLSREMKEFVLSIPGNTSRQVFMLSPCATVASYHAHMILDYGPVLSQGLTARKAEVDALLAAEQDPDRRDFLQAMSLSLEGVLIYARRLAERIERELTLPIVDRPRLERMLAICRKVPAGPPETFAEAVQAMWTVKAAVEVAHPVYLHCFGRLDQELYPFYQRDLDRGAISRPEAVELLAELLLKVMSQNIRPESNILSNFYHRFLGSTPITLGGVTPAGEDAANELTSVFLEAADRSRAVANVSVRIHRGSPGWLLEQVAGHLHDGAGSFSLFSDEINIRAMVRRGFAEEHARDYAVMGCVETTVPGRTGPMSANALQLAQLLNITLHNGDCRMLAGTIRADGPRTGDPGSFSSFDELLEAFFTQARSAIDKIVAGSNLRDRIFARQQPAPLISAFVDGCLENGRDVTRGGARYVFAGVSMINSIANLVDSLLVIKKLVFERRLVTLPELVSASDENYIGHEELLREIQAVSGKWGNGDPECDELARDVTRRLFGMTYEHRTEMGGPVVAYVISMITHTIDGRLSMASVDGRRIATPFAASCNPYNVERNGVTAALRSVAALPFEDVMGCAVNMKFHPSAVGENAAARKKWAALIKTYFELGGSQLQPTVVSAETLRAAQTDPDRHKDIIVKVGGYSTYFVNLGREIQDEVIGRTEHGR